MSAYGPRNLWLVCTVLSPASGKSPTHYSILGSGCNVKQFSANAAAQKKGKNTKNERKAMENCLASVNFMCGTFGHKFVGLRRRARIGFTNCCLILCHFHWERDKFIGSAVNTCFSVIFIRCNLMKILAATKLNVLGSASCLTLFFVLSDLWPL